MATTTPILDRDLFVQAFWAKCREVVRPELDRAVERLRERDIEAEIASQEFDATAVQSSAARAKDPGPSLTLTAGNSPAEGRPRLAFYGDVLLQRVLVFAGRRKTATAYTLDQLTEPEARAIVCAWEAKVASSIRAKEPAVPPSA
jgi:hypothetical protein